MKMTIYFREVYLLAKSEKLKWYTNFMHISRVSAQIN